MAGVNHEFVGENNPPNPPHQSDGVETSVTPEGSVVHAQVTPLDVQPPHQAPQPEDPLVVPQVPQGAPMEVVPEACTSTTCENNRNSPPRNKRSPPRRHNRSPPRNGEAIARGGNAQHSPRRESSGSGDERHRGPLSRRIMDIPLPRGLEKPPILDKYDGTTDPDEQIQSVETALDYRNLRGSIKCKLFPLSLIRGASTWWRNLPPGSIDSWEELCRMFTAQFTTSRRHPKIVASLKAIVQGLREGTKFQEAVGIVEVETLDAFFELAQRYIKWEEKQKASEVRRPRNFEVGGPSSQRAERRGDEKKREGGKVREAKPPKSQFTYHTPLNAPRDRILSEISSAEFKSAGIRFPKQLPVKPNVDKKKFCRFHKSHGHVTEDCVHLKDAIEILIQKGYARQYVDGQRAANNPPRQNQLAADQASPEPNVEEDSAIVLADFVAEMTTPTTSEKNKWTIFVDGSSNSQGSGAGIILENGDGVLIEVSLGLSFPMTNNQAEYEAFLAGLRLAEDTGAEEIEIFTDSQLVASQVSGEYQTKEERLLEYLNLIKKKLAKFKETEETLTMPSIKKAIEVMHVCAIDNQSWMASVYNFLKSNTLPADAKEVTKIRKRACSYVLLDDKLYRRGFSISLLKCVEETRVEFILQEIHEGINGQHIGGRSLARKALRAGYYWPTMQNDAKDHVLKCDKCQRHGDMHIAPANELKTLVSPWPFVWWGMDILGPFPTAARQVKYLIVVVDYFTK
ncbi:hypothetical protein TSUD_21590 [Trifolium subterraneum]|uniref:RNase H type-1 domain-containing protein n=1 Tax=Trifolium subterraneum TaxID=3900 RepID=A0A2Z6MV66_TRISU|nr:hypothetical protein TSUD_21590 [Trifolium subterraneum]